MTDDPPHDSQARIERDKRRAAALRANLKRRKAQLRGRADADPSDTPEPDDGLARPINSP